MREQIREALWRVDPVGVQDDRLHAPEEYDSLSTSLTRLVVDRRTESEMRDWLQNELDTNWGVTDALDSTSRILEEILRFPDSKGNL